MTLWATQKLGINEYYAKLEEIPGADRVVRFPQNDPNTPQIVDFKARVFWELDVKATP